MGRLFLPVLLLSFTCFFGCSSSSTKKFNLAMNSQTNWQPAHTTLDSLNCAPGLAAFLALEPAQKAQWRSRADQKLKYFRKVQHDRDRLMNRRGRFAFQEGTHLETARLGVGLIKSLPGLQEAVRLDPSYCEVWAMLGHLTSEVGDNHQAMKYLNTAKCVAQNLALAGHPVDPDSL